MEEPTRKFATAESKYEIKATLDAVYNALEIKGYNPVKQIVGYIVTEDPTYITSYDSARQLLTRLDRDDILEELIKSYLGK